MVEALGVTREQAKGAVRFSLGWNTTDDEIDYALAVIPEAVHRLRNHAERRITTGASS